MLCLQLYSGEKNLGKRLSCTSNRWENKKKKTRKEKEVHLKLETAEHIERFSWYPHYTVCLRWRDTSILFYSNLLWTSMWQAAISVNDPFSLRLNVQPFHSLVFHYMVSALSKIICKMMFYFKSHCEDDLWEGKQSDCRVVHYHIHYKQIRLFKNCLSFTTWYYFNIYH